MAIKRCGRTTLRPSLHPRSKDFFVSQRKKVNRCGVSSWWPACRVILIRRQIEDGVQKHHDGTSWAHATKPIPAFPYPLTFCCRSLFSPVSPFQSVCCRIKVEEDGVHG
ncbi:hypothetical protein Trydic_g18907 [Trypoxylus dichotomus]